MMNKIGFVAETQQPRNKDVSLVSAAKTLPVPSVVRVWFGERGAAYSYFNDRFDLHCGDLVYVEGKLEGLVGRVTEVSHNFKIKLSDYKRVIGLVDCEVHGQFFMAGSHFVTFDPLALPFEKALSWYKPAPREDEIFVTGFDGSTFSLGDLKTMQVSDAIGERGCEYYGKNKVRYLCIDGEKGIALVQGSETYEVEFEYRQGEIGHLTCSCYCSGHCKHGVAAMLQLRDLLEIIEKEYVRQWNETGYFAAVYKVELFKIAVDGMETGSITL